jgi:hypothetical protein
MNSQHSLNTVCPYYTMFPLEFPERVLRAAGARELVADPYCGRGTTIYAARLRGLRSYGVDSSPVAVAISRAKVASTSLSAVMQAYDRMLKGVPWAETPTGRFWKLAYHVETLSVLCRLRVALRRSLRKNGASESDAVAMLRAVALGALHGPLNAAGLPGSYFSNQMPRTFAPKPDYAARYWSARDLRPHAANLRDIIRKRAKNILGGFVPPSGTGWIVAGDSRKQSAWEMLPGKISRVITSPPYYGMNTYEEDQWLRVWFLGGPSAVEYGNKNQLSHRSPADFAKSMAKVWDQIGDHARPDIAMAVRFGGIGSHKSDYRQIMADSLEHSKHHWRMISTRDAGDAADGRRQADTMGKRAKSSIIEERDFYVHLS